MSNFEPKFPFKYKDANSVEIQCLHCSGKRREGKPRPIIVRFLRYKDCQTILALGPRLCGTNFRIFQDLSFEIAPRRKKQMTILRRLDRTIFLLDFFLVNQGVANITALSDIHPGYKSMIALKISLHLNDRGPGLWKLITSFRTEINFFNQIKATIQEMQDEYN